MSFARAQAVFSQLCLDFPLPVDVTPLLETCRQFIASNHLPPIHLHPNFYRFLVESCEKEENGDAPVVKLLRLLVCDVVSLILKLDNGAVLNGNDDDPLPSSVSCFFYPLYESIISNVNDKNDDTTFNSDTLAADSEYHVKDELISNEIDPCYESDDSDIAERNWQNSFKNYMALQDHHEDMSLEEFEKETAKIVSNRTETVFDNQFCINAPKNCVMNRVQLYTTVEHLSLQWKCIFVRLSSSKPEVMDSVEIRNRKGNILMDVHNNPAVQTIDEFGVLENIVCTFKNDFLRKSLCSCMRDLMLLKPRNITLLLDSFYRLMLLENSENDHLNFLLAIEQIISSQKSKLLYLYSDLFDIVRVYPLVSSEFNIVKYHQVNSDLSFTDVNCKLLEDINTSHVEIDYLSDFLSKNIDWLINCTKIVFVSKIYWNFEVFRSVLLLHLICALRSSISLHNFSPALSWLRKFPEILPLINQCEKLCFSENSNISSLLRIFLLLLHQSYGQLIDLGISEKFNSNDVYYLPFEKLMWICATNVDLKPCTNIIESYFSGSFLLLSTEHQSKSLYVDMLITREFSVFLEYCLSCSRAGIIGVLRKILTCISTQISTFSVDNVQNSSSSDNKSQHESKNAESNVKGINLNFKELLVEECLNTNVEEELEIKARRHRNFFISKLSVLRNLLKSYIIFFQNLEDEASGKLCIKAGGRSGKND